jgi:HSP20 family protein
MMARQHSSLLTEIGQFHQDMEQLFFELCKPARSFTRLARGKWQPNADVYQVGEALVIRMELAGVQPEDIAVTGEREYLIISGARRDNEADQREAYHQLEIHYGEFERVFPLPWPVHQTDISATYEDGFLTVRVTPKPTETSTPRRIEINR